MMKPKPVESGLLKFAIRAESICRSKYEGDVCAGFFVFFRHQFRHRFQPSIVSQLVQQLPRAVTGLPRQIPRIVRPN